MKKIILFFVIFISVNQSKSQVLTVSQVTQEQNQWCWAGVSACILDYYCTPTAQCTIAEYTRTVETFPDISFGSTNCCVSPSSCNNWNYNWGGPGSIQDILVHFANISNYGVGSSLTQANITSDIQNNRVFVIRWAWDGGGGHFLVGHGLIGNNMYYMDPWYGEGLKIADYSWVCLGGGHTWAHTNRLSVSPFSNPPASAGTITGNTTVCSGSSNTYSISAVSGATSYTWSLPSGWSGTSTTTSINTTASTTSGNITVTANNACGSSSAQALAVTVNTVPAQPSVVTGSTTPCQTTSQIYSVTNVAGVTYTWTFPTGWTQTGGGTTNSVTVTVGAGTGNITVTPSNACGNGTARTLTVTVNTVPAQSGTITGNTTVCSGSSNTYIISAVSGATSYTWS